MNVKPGDIARITGGNLGNAGAIVLVERAYSATEWVVEALQPLVGARIAGRIQMRPGQRGVCRDSNLRRVDPPSDDVSSNLSQPELVA